MRVSRLDGMPGFTFDRVAAAVGDDPETLRMENLDTDLPPSAAAVEATRAAIGEDETNSWLPFVFSNEPVERLALLGERVRAALAATGRTP